MKLADYILPGARKMRRRIQELETRINSLREVRDDWKVRAKNAEAGLKKCNREFHTDPHRTRAILNELVGEFSQKTGYTFPVTVFPGIDIADDMIWSSNTRAYFVAGLSAFENIEKAVRNCNLNPRRILDLPCGHGRVARFLRAWKPDAALLCCDLQEQGVAFCARELQGVPVKSYENPAQIILDNPVDLIWVGSLFTHLPVDKITSFLQRFSEFLRPGGLLIFTTHGEKALTSLLNGKSYDLRNCDPESVRAEVAADGFSYRAYHYSPDYGVSFGTREHMESLGKKVQGLEAVSFEPAGWGGHQDVHVWRRTETRG